jgi:hypothetical protein
MPPRTQHDTRPILSASAFRRVVCDGRVLSARAIPTLTVLSRAGRLAQTVRPRGGRPDSSRP